ncbi:MAG: DUF4105 domain-containing protein [Prolixibacteraceae bacterium]|jgi:hypothetical protein|nr:DUF4105 domain-containing protein [Prolixibacteraceae bacterium]
MRRIVFFTLFLLLSAIYIKAEPAKLSQNARIAMFTCDPGQELYAGFGHSALWVSDPANGIDRLYNYGTFDFNTPNFYVKFIRGKLNYMLSVTNINRFMREYDYRKIGVEGQTLNLLPDEKQKLYNLLEENAKPENRSYKYDFFMDNCATRIRDIVAEAVDGEIDFNTQDQDVSFRQLLFPYLTHTPWTKFGINLILGLSSDAKASPYDYMYLPEHMEYQFGRATIDSNNGERELVSSEKQYLKNKLEYKYNILYDPAVVFTFFILIVLLISLWENRKNVYFKALDVTLSSVSAFAGLFLFFMWVGTDHSATNYNLNILWLLPAQTLFLFALRSKKNKKRMVEISMGILFVTAIAMQFWPQETELSFLLLIVMFFIRYLFYYKRIE